MSFIKVTRIYEDEGKEDDRTIYFVNSTQILYFFLYNFYGWFDGTKIFFRDGKSMIVLEEPHEIVSLIKRGGSLKEIKCPICGSSDIKTERYSNDDHLTLEEAKQKTKPAAAYLRRYQDWRTGKDERTMTEAGIEPKELTAAINQILDFFEEKGGGE